MDKQLATIRKINKRLTDIHILTKTTDKNWFHKDTESAYEFAFETYHDIKEMLQNIEAEPPEKVINVADEAYMLLEELQDTINEMVKENKNIALDNLLRGLSEKWAWICWDLRKHL